MSARNAWSIGIIRLRSGLRNNTQQNGVARFGLPDRGVISRPYFQADLNKEFSK
jgi:hypothetical protein